MTVSTLDDRLDDTFAALANATRRAILARLAHGEATVNELAAPFDMKLPAISKHIKVLEQAGFSAVERSDYMASTHPELRVDEISAVARARYGERHYSLFVEASG